MTDKKKKKEIHGIVSTTVSFPNKIPEKTARVIAEDVEKVMFQTVDLINKHYQKKLGLTYDVLQVGFPALDEFLTQEQAEHIIFH